MAEAIRTENVRYSRFWLYTPFVLLLLVAIAWSVAWFFIRNRAAEALDAWIASEAQRGRQWACADRTIAGYPFRIEIVCNTLELKQGAVTASFGRTEAIAQVYQPRLVIVEVAGPMRVTDGKANVQGQWDLLQASIHASRSGLQRLSVAATSPKFTVTGLAPQDIATSCQYLELHLRPNPSRASEKAYDAALSIRQATVPLLDALIGGSELTDLNADVTVTQATGFQGRPIAQELERWRSAGGTLDVLTLAAAKGPRRIEAKGKLNLDEEHRPAGQLTVAAAGLDGLIGNITGNRAGGALLGALLGQNPRAQGGSNGKPQLAQLPQLTLNNGYLAMGPFVIPNVRLQPLY
ncbi:DUF2125 domain-containing protein [Microvirga guangxiensis]|uniref:DUF2125 domain-containing protein n=1 Tax=Microvirga guangxiensis TaxID=549386 RepID=A0A1G5EI87_9HYPH|nr:DUF2125 domain-containing protein [Microvirga guangxiensis]SCY26662.1 hypothetical protein SAMN02927923_01001 [Microvirga guangxiensis]